MTSKPRLYAGIITIRVPKAFGLEDVHVSLYTVWARSKEEAMGKSITTALESHPTGNISNIDMGDITDIANNPPKDMHHG